MNDVILIDLINYQSKDYKTYLIKSKKNNFINYSIVKKKTKIYKISKFFQRISLAYHIWIF